MNLPSVRLSVGLLACVALIGCDARLSHPVIDAVNASDVAALRAAMVSFQNVPDDPIKSFIGRATETFGTLTASANENPGGDDFEPVAAVSSNKGVWELDGKIHAYGVTGSSGQRGRIVFETCNGKAGDICGARLEMRKRN